MRARTAWIELVTANYFNVLGVQPSLGRAFAPDDERAAGASPVIVLSHELWKQRFNGDAGVIGRAVRVNGRTFTVVGVAPSDPRLLLIVTIVVLGVVALAGFLPARRAGRVSPVEALRAE